MVVSGSDSFPAAANIAAQHQAMLNDTIAAVMKAAMPAVALKGPMPAVALKGPMPAVALKFPMPAVALKFPMPDPFGAAASIAAKHQARLNDTIAAAALKIPIPDAFGAAALKIPIPDAFGAAALKIPIPDAFAAAVANFSAQQRAILNDTIAAAALKFEPPPFGTALDNLMHAALNGGLKSHPAADVADRVALTGEQAHSTDLEAEWSEALLRYAASVVSYAIGFGLLVSLLAASGYGETALSILVTVLIGLPKPPSFE